MGKHDEGEGLSVKEMEQMMDLASMANEELHPDLAPWMEEGQWGPMLRHPLVYMVPLALPGMANKAYKAKREALRKAIEAWDWHTVVFLHERPYRLKALIDSVTGRYDDEGGSPIPLRPEDGPDVLDLVADVWIDSENIEQNEEEWRALIGGPVPHLWLGTLAERVEFNALPDPIPAWRGGTVGDWSWTTDIQIARFFAQRSKYPIRRDLIPKADVFGYFTRRGESELLVRLTPEREPLVYPNRFDAQSFRKP